MNGNTLGGIFIIIYGVLLIGGVDYYLRPKIISKGSEIHPLTAMVGVFGGLKFFGFTGILIGPMVAALFMTMFEFFHSDYLKDASVNTDKRKKAKK
jgi:predicted PurR-regulated permease PerM